MNDDSNGKVLPSLAALIELRQLLKMWNRCTLVVRTSILFISPYSYTLIVAFGYPPSNADPSDRPVTSVSTAVAPSSSRPSSATTAAQLNPPVSTTAAELDPPPSTAAAQSDPPPATPVAQSNPPPADPVA